MPLGPCSFTSARSASVRAQATQSAAMTSARVSRAVTTPPAPRAKPPSGLGSCGPRLLTMITELLGRVRVTYARIEDPGLRLSTLCMNGLSITILCSPFMEMASEAPGVPLGDAVGDALGDAVGDPGVQPSVPLRKISWAWAPQPCAIPGGCLYQSR